jgi:zona occludens toxin (predicted ATPase)
VREKRILITFAHLTMMNTARNKSQLVLLLLVVIALVFFMSSFIAATFTNNVSTNTTPTNSDGSSQASTDIVSCISLRTGEERVFGECSVR